MAKMSAKRKPVTSMSREERIQKVMALTGFSRGEAELHTDLVDGKTVGDVKPVAPKKAAKTA